MATFPIPVWTIAGGSKTVLDFNPNGADKLLITFANFFDANFSGLTNGQIPTRVNGLWQNTTPIILDGAGQPYQAGKVWQADGNKYVAVQAGVVLEGTTLPTLSDGQVGDIWLYRDSVGQIIDIRGPKGGFGWNDSTGSPLIFSGGGGGGGGGNDFPDGIIFSTGTKREIRTPDGQILIKSSTQVGLGGITAANDIGLLVSTGRNDGDPSLFTNGVMIGPFATSPIDTNLMLAGSGTGNVEVMDNNLVPGPTTLVASGNSRKNFMVSTWIPQGITEALTGTRIKVPWDTDPARSTIAGFVYVPADRWFICAKADWYTIDAHVSYRVRPSTASAGHVELNLFAGANPGTGNNPPVPFTGPIVNYAPYPARPGVGPDIKGAVPFTRRLFCDLGDVIQFQALTPGTSGAELTNGGCLEIRPA